MRVLIKTIPLVYGNYGGILQAYALQVVLRRLGVEATTDTPIGLPYSWKTMPRYARDLVTGGKWDAAIPISLKNDVTSELDSFVERHLDTVNVFGDWNRRPNRAILEEFDSIVVGSDQVWRPKYVNVCQYFLNFASDLQIVRVAYAASFGRADLKEFTPKMLSECGVLARKFDALSVREESAVGLFRDAWGLDVETLVDPTLLLAAEDYWALVRGSQSLPIRRGTLLCMLLDPDRQTMQKVERLALKLGLEVVNPLPQTLRSKSEYRLNPGRFRYRAVEDWLSGFAEANFVVTDSYHGTVFSLIFNTPFLTLGNSARGQSRFDSLLNLTGLGAHLVDDLSSASLEESMTETDWARVNTVISSERDRAIRYLRTSLDI